MTTITHVLNSKQIEAILILNKVSESKVLLDTKDVVYFETNLPDDIKNDIYKNLGLDLRSLDLIPMRWIKGDTSPHIDRGVVTFLNTYLIYLTDSFGDLILGETHYPIKAGSGFIFKESTNHYTVNTGEQPRLLIGPMSESGFRVGAGDYLINLNPSQTAYIKQETNILYWSTDQTNWNSIGYGPIAITNLDPPNGLVYVKFITDITIANTSFYFKCSSDKIQFGDTNLKVDGSRSKIIINFDNYLGLIQNGDVLSNGRSYIYIYNLNIDASGKTLDPNQGWFGQQYFGKASTSNYIINCTSNGIINLSSGGIVGSNATNINIYGCSSSGDILASGGGIVGSNSENITCQSCYSSGVINVSAGGIIGANSISCNSLNSYSLGTIDADAGGIYGSSCNTCIAQNCYSTGNISLNAGGIFGSSSNSCTATNCYTLGSLITRGTGIFGISAVNSLTNNCYPTDGTPWQSSLAQNLSGSPIGSAVGSIWTSTGLNSPYELTNMGYTPYNINNIIGTPPSLNGSYSQTITAGQSSISAIINNKSYTILQTSGDANYFTINSVTGVITTSSNTPSGTYTVYIRNAGSYNITTIILTVNGSTPIPCLTEHTNILTPGGYVEIKKLKIGDLVTTSDDRHVEIKDIFHETVRGHAETYPCIVNKDSLGEGYPKKDFRISQLHLIKVGDKWIMPKQHFKLDTSIQTITYYHIRLEDYKKDHLVINDGVIVESLSNTTEDVIEYYRRIGRLLYHDKENDIVALLDF